MSDVDFVWVLDSSAIINSKRRVAKAKQWSLLKRLEEMVESGHVAFPRQVKDELENIVHPDAPGVWCLGVFPSMRYQGMPSIEAVRRVMATDAAQVVDVTKMTEDADPYIIAMGLELIDTGREVCVVTDDTVDNPTRIALTSACEIVKLDHCTLESFLDDLPGW